MQPTAQAVGIREKGKAPTGRKTSANVSLHSIFIRQTGFPRHHKKHSFQEELFEFLGRTTWLTTRNTFGVDFCRPLETFSSLTITHGWRRGLHSCAASRLGLLGIVEHDAKSVPWDESQSQ